MKLPLDVILGDGDITKALTRIAEALESLVEASRGKSSIGIRSRYQDLEQKDDYKSNVFYPEDEDKKKKVPGMEFDD